MLRYCYSTDYDTTAPVLDSAKMYAMGDKYDMQGLKLKAKENFVAHLPVSAGDFIAAIPVIYTSTPDTDRGLRDNAAAFAVYHWKTLFAMPDFKKAIAENVDFVNDVVEKRSPSAENTVEISPLKRQKGLGMYRQRLDDQIEEGPNDFIRGHLG